MITSSRNARQQQLADEIAKIEAELERKRLEDEIKAMEEAIAHHSKANGPPGHRKKVQKPAIKQQDNPPPPQTEEVDYGYGDPPAQKAVNDYPDYGYGDSTPVQPVPSAPKAQRRGSSLGAQIRLAEEIERMENALRQAQEAEQQRLRSVIEAQVHYVENQESFAESDSEFDEESEEEETEEEIIEEYVEEEEEEEIIEEIVEEEVVEEYEEPEQDPFAAAIAAAASRRKAGSSVGGAPQRPRQAKSVSELPRPRRKKPAGPRSVHPAPPPPVRPEDDLMASVAAAARNRGQRLQDTGGKLHMQEIEPEVKAPKQQSTPQLSYDFAELVTKKARDREKRLEEGGEKRMTKIKEKEEYKKDFNDICIEAAQLGRLTRLNEHTVEAVAQEKTPEQEWKSNGLLAIQWRSNYMSVIHEAAALGNQTKMPEKIVSNDPEEEQDWEDTYGEEVMSPRMRQLLELNQQVGEGQHKVDKLVLGRKEENAGGDSLIVKPMEAYTRVEDVQLPRKRPPKIDPTKKKEELAKKLLTETGGRPLISISHDVAERAWERRARLDRPGSMPKMKEICTCPYCENPSPYQTHAYRELERRRREEGYVSPDSEEERKKAREARRIARRKARGPRAGQPPQHDEAGGETSQRSTRSAMEGPSSPSRRSSRAGRGRRPAGTEWGATRKKVQRPQQPEYFVPTTPDEPSTSVPDRTSSHSRSVPTQRSSHKRQVPGRTPSTKGAPTERPQPSRAAPERASSVSQAERQAPGRTKSNRATPKAVPPPAPKPVVPEQRLPTKKTPGGTKAAKGSKKNKATADAEGKGCSIM